MRAILLSLLLAATAGSSGINTRVYPQVIVAGSSIWLTCRVTPDERNRKLIYGIAGSEQEQTERQLDGYGAKITWGPTEIKRIPCDAGPAYCIVVRNDGTTSRDIKDITIGGCEPIS
jgi:hypothetical protein